MLVDGLFVLRLKAFRALAGFFNQDLESELLIMSSPYTAFFYGTLLHPSILRRVIGHHGTDLRISPALLPVSSNFRVANCVLSTCAYRVPSFCPRGQRERYTYRVAILIAILSLPL